MNGTDFIGRARRHARRAGETFRFDPRHGKGGHGVLYVGERRTTVKRGELKPGAFRAMLKQLLRKAKLGEGGRHVEGWT